MSWKDLSYSFKGAIIFGGIYVLLMVILFPLGQPAPESWPAWALPSLPGFFFWYAFNFSSSSLSENLGYFIIISISFIVYFLIGLIVGKIWEKIKLKSQA